MPLGILIHCLINCYLNASCLSLVDTGQEVGWQTGALRLSSSYAVGFLGIQGQGVLSLTDPTVKATSWEDRPAPARKCCGDSHGAQPLASLCPEVPLRHQQWSTAVSREDCVPAGKWGRPICKEEGSAAWGQLRSWSFLLGKVRAMGG